MKTYSLMECINVTERKVENIFDPEFMYNSTEFFLNLIV
jgi:hypothetical protein